MTHVQPALFAAAQTQPTSDDYYTPAWLFERMGITFDVDVASPPGGLSWIPAARYFTKEDDGLAQEWTGRVWMNPPFSKPAPWIDKFIAHGNGICLVPCGRARWYIDLWAKADGICTPGRFSFAAGRIDASGKLNGDIRFPVKIAAFGPECVEAIRRIGVVRVVA